MGLKNTAMKFFWSDDMEEQQEEYTRPRLLKSGHLNIMVRTPKSVRVVRRQVAMNVSQSGSKFVASSKPITSYSCP